MSIDTQEVTRGGRIDTIDLARGLALVAMAIYHFTWDLEFFGYVTPGLTAFGGWKLFARCIASSFLFLAGVSLLLAHGDRMRWPGFWRRFAMVAGAALAITIVTYLAVPGGFIFFGILHQIALASLLGLAFLRLPAVLNVAVALLVIAAPHYLRSAAFDHPALWWVGLTEMSIRSNDYVPVFPWFGAVLLGIAAARMALQAGLFDRLRPVRFGAWARPLLFAGRHSLAVYLIHQPVLIASLWLGSQIMPPTAQPPEMRFAASCQNACVETRDMEFCTRYCACMLDTLQSEGALDQLFSSVQDAEFTARIEAMAATCTATTDDSMLEGGAMLQEGMAQ